MRGQYVLSQTIKTSLKSFFKVAGIHLILFLLGSVGFIVSFHLGALSFIDVFFYRGLILILIWALLATAAMLFLKRWRFSALLDYKDIILLFIAFCCIHVVFFTHLPVTADRSVSVFMLGYMADHQDEGFTEKEIEEVFTEKYVKEYQAFAKRFHEQEISGTIREIENGEYQISERGLSLMKLYEWIADWFNIDNKLIHPS